MTESSLPRSHKGRWRRVLQLLAEAGGTLPRAEIKARIEPLSESHLSHLLRDLEDAGLARRHRPDRCREVQVQLLPAGRELVAAAAEEPAREPPPRRRPVKKRVSQTKRKPRPSTAEATTVEKDWAPWLS